MMQRKKNDNNVETTADVINVKCLTEEKGLHMFMNI